MPDPIEKYLMMTVNKQIKTHGKLRLIIRIFSSVFIADAIVVLMCAQCASGAVCRGTTPLIHCLFHRSPRIFSRLAILEFFSFFFFRELRHTWNRACKSSDSPKMSLGIFQGFLQNFHPVFLRVSTKNFCKNTLRYDYK